MDTIIRRETVGEVEVTLTRSALGQVADYTVSRGGEFVGSEDNKKDGLRLYGKTVKETRS